MEEFKNQLIVSCQALEDEPLHSSYIMSKMALAAYQGGAKGIRANSVEDIQAIRQEVSLPIIGIIKKIMMIVIYISHQRFRKLMSWLEQELILLL